ncbi:MAG: HAMP domain-containing histidine kinase [Blastocatellia bacterium]|nr:HAMP domain-containing histidine kinase [Blastocatellia bacterium]
MRIRTQLFLGTAVMLLALVGFQWWLQIQQLKAIERELNEVAANVGQAVFFREIHSTNQNGQITVKVEETPKPPAPGGNPPTAFVFTSKDGTPPPDILFKTKDGKPLPGAKQYHERVTITKDDGKNQTTAQSERVFVTDEKTGPNQIIKQFKDHPVRVEVEKKDDTFDRMLVVRGAPGGERRIPLPPSHSLQIVQKTQTQGLIAGSLLMLIGWLMAAMFAHRVTQPLRKLANGVEALARGELGTQVEVTSKGEVGELQASFNRMSARLAELEHEKEAWKAREHLAELGDLARGLGHTLRNPLNTLGLIVEELGAKVNGEGEEMVATARGQIRRIDNWLRSFLAIGAGGAAEPEVVDLSRLVQDVAFELVQGGKNLELDATDEPIRAKVVPSALRSALANLIGNAFEASPEGEVVHVKLSNDGFYGMIHITDRGPGMPVEVRQKLFTPHVTTKTGGSGMGLFLAKQLIEGGHRGKLEMIDNPDGGTIAVVRIPLVRD